MNHKKATLCAISSVITIVCVAGILFASRSILRKITENAEQETYHVASNALMRYESELTVSDVTVVIPSQSTSKLDSTKPSVDKHAPVTESNDKINSDTNSNINPGATAPESQDNIIQLDDGSYVYVIQWGDTLCEISAKLSYSVDELAEYNHIKDVNMIYATSVLRIPPKKE